jgi:hypothetical protein
VEVKGLAEVNGYIDEFIDVNTEAVNETLTPDGMFAVSGHKIKIIGDNASVGIYFVPEANPEGRVKVSGHLAENTSVKLIGVIPLELVAGTWQLEVVTQFSGGSHLLKEPRNISFGHMLTVPLPGSA